MDNSNDDDYEADSEWDEEGDPEDDGFNSRMQRLSSRGWDSDAEDEEPLDPASVLELQPGDSYIAYPARDWKTLLTNGATAPNPGSSKSIGSNVPGRPLLADVVLVRLQGVLQPLVTWTPPDDSEEIPKIPKIKLAMRKRVVRVRGQIHYRSREHFYHKERDRLKIARVSKITAIIVRGIKEQTPSTNRGIFYKAKHEAPALFKSQVICDNLVNVLACTIGMRRRDLNVGASPFGSWSAPRGGVKLTLRTGQIAVSSGLPFQDSLPSEVDVEGISVDPCILAVVILEKDTTLKALLREIATYGFRYPLLEHCTMFMTANGAGDYPTRLFARLIGEQNPHVKASILVDGDSWGARIALTYRNSSATSFNEELDLPSLEWIGIFYEDTEKLRSNGEVVTMGTKDEAMVSRMLTMPPNLLPESWRKPLQRMSDNGKMIGLEGIPIRRLTELLEKKVGNLLGLAEEKQPVLSSASTRDWPTGEDEYGMGDGGSGGGFGLSLAGEGLFAMGNGAGYGELLSFGDGGGDVNFSLGGGYGEPDFGDGGGGDLNFNWGAESGSSAGHGEFSFGDGGGDLNFNWGAESGSSAGHGEFSFGDGGEDLNFGGEDAYGMGSGAGYGEFGFGGGGGPGEWSGDGTMGEYFEPF
ncbi:Spo11/DNA topoisomerase VI subunit A [Mycena polygramma]|nr:Spo11/DNA topoisomerase VI subunit A [Mycena polygramma]